MGAIIQRKTLFACPQDTRRPGRPGPGVFEPQRGRQHPIGKAGITDADPLELGIEHRAAVVHAGHPDVDRDAEIGDPREQIGRLRTCRTCGARARQARPLGVRIEPNHRVGALFLQHVIPCVHAGSALFVVRRSQQDRQYRDAPVHGVHNLVPKAPMTRSYPAAVGDTANAGSRQIKSDLRETTGRTGKR